MIVSYNVLFDYVNIGFQLAFFSIVISKCSGNIAKMLCKNMLAFSYIAIPTRHEVHEKPTD